MLTVYGVRIMLYNFQIQYPTYARTDTRTLLKYFIVFTTGNG